MTIHPWQITAGVVLGVLIGGVAVYRIGHDPIQRIIADPVASFHQLTRGDIRPALQLSEKEQQRQATDQAKAKTLRDEQARQLRADQDKAGGSEALEAAARKERAWAKFYKKPPQCDGNPNNETMTECANHYIRAKRRFEEAYAAGKP
jgi:hypothetical protein